MTVSIVTWNIQNGKGCDGVIDLARTARVIRAMGEADVICLQEIARYEPAYGNVDQAAELQGLFRGYEAFFGVALHRGGNRQYGNLILSRLPVLQVFNHLLPHPAEGGIKHMQRQAIEAVVQAAAGPLRVMTTHLEYYSAQHRSAQIERLQEIHLEACAPHLHVDEAGSYQSYERGKGAIVCGDFNLKPEDPLHRKMLDGGFVDAWQALNPGKPHPHSFRLFEKEETPYCCDFVFVTPDLVPRLRSIRIDAETKASDHQPVIVEIH